MDEEVSTTTPSQEGKGTQQASKRTSGIANMLTFLHRPSIDTDNDPRSSDRPRKSGNGGKVKPGHRHMHSSSGDLNAGEPTSPGSGAHADSSPWNTAGFAADDITDTLSLSHMSPAPITTGTPSRAGSNFFKNPFKKRGSHKGSASPGMPGSPVLPGLTPPHGSGQSFTASGSSLSGAGGSQSPPDWVSRAAAVEDSAAASFGPHNSRKPGQHGSSADVDEAEFGSCCSEVLPSPNFAFQDAMYPEPTMDLHQVSCSMSGAASPMTNLCQELPEVFTPGFNQLLHQSSANAQQSPDSLLDATVRFDATVALVSTAQLANAGQVYEAQSQLLSGTSPTVASAAGLGASDASAGASLDMAVRKSDGSSSRGPSLLEVEDVEEVSPAASHQCIVQADQEPVTADDISICVEQSSTMPLNTTEDPHIDTPLAAPAAACDGLDASLRDTAAPSAQPSAAGAQPLTSLPCAAEPCEIGNAEMTAVPAERCEQHALQPDVSGGPTSTPAATSAVSEAPAAVGTGNHSETTRQSRDAPDAECDVASSEQQPVIVSSKETCIDEDAGAVGAMLSAQTPAEPRSSNLQGQTAETAELTGAQSTGAHMQPATGAIAVEASLVHAAASVTTATCSYGMPPPADHQHTGDNTSAAGLEATGAAAAMPGNSPAQVTPLDPEVNTPEAHAELLLGDQIVDTNTTQAPQQQACTLEADSNMTGSCQTAGSVGTGLHAEAVVKPDAEAGTCLKAIATNTAGCDSSSPEPGNVNISASTSAGAPALEQGSAPEVHQQQLHLETAALELSGPPADACGAAPVPQVGAAPVNAHEPVADQDTAAEVVEPAVSTEMSGLVADAEETPPEHNNLTPEASQEPALPEEGDKLLDSPAACSPAADPSSPVITAASRASRRSIRTPPSMVRESMPLFVKDAMWAAGSPMAGEDSLDDQDLQQLEEPTQAAGAAGRLLTHGGPQRVALGGYGSSQYSMLTPVAEGFTTSPIPEETSTGGSSQSKTSSRYDAAAAGSPGSSPVRHLTASGYSLQPVSSPQFGMTPGSVLSTPTLHFAAPGALEGHMQLNITPASAVSSAVGSAIRDIGSACAMNTVGRGASPHAPAGLPEASPTMALLPNMVAGSELGQDGSGSGITPSLLDAKAASPSAVWQTAYTTPFRGALAALPIDAAVNAPLMDSSPLDLTDDGSFMKSGFAAEAQRVAQNLAAAAAGGFGATPLPARTPGAALHTPGTALHGHLRERTSSPELTGELRDGMVDMLIKKVAGLEKRVKDLEGENLRWKEQIEIYEFEKTELNSQEEMEKQARSYAEEQLQQCQMELQAMRQAKGQQQAQMVALKQEFEVLRQQAEQKHLQDKEQHTRLEEQLLAMQEERNQALDRVNLLDMQMTAVKSNAAELQGLLQKEQARSTELEALLAARDRELQDMMRIQHETQLKMDKALEQLIASKTAKEHLHQKAADEAAKATQFYAERQQLLAERQNLVAQLDKRNTDWQTLKAKYAQKSSTLKEVEKRLADKEAEAQELFGMCEQLLQQQEAQRKA